MWIQYITENVQSSTIRGLLLWRKKTFFCFLCKSMVLNLDKLDKRLEKFENSIEKTLQ